MEESCRTAMDIKSSQGDAMNEITKIEILITADMWQPFKRDSDKELDDLLGQLKAKTLLKHFGNVRTIIR